MGGERERKGKGERRGREERGERGSDLRIRDVTCTIVFLDCSPKCRITLHLLVPNLQTEQRKHNEVGRKEGGRKEGGRKGGRERGEEGGREGGRKEGQRKEGGTEEGGKEEKERRNPTIIFCPPLALCKALLHWSMSIISLFPVSFIVSMAVITSGCQLGDISGG